VVRALVVGVGLLVTLVGVLLLVLPGPALAVIPVGLALLALEFAWAERALQRTQDMAETVWRRARSGHERRG
jgi:tellurite resistance protein TerC